MWKLKHNKPENLCSIFLQNFEILKTKNLRAHNVFAIQEFESSS